jgi:hypothetical protein
MAEMILPGVFIEVRPEGLIVPQGVTVGNLGVVGTASKGPIGKPVVLGSYAAAQEHFGDYDPWINGNSHELTLVRALEQAYRQGATTAIAVRVAVSSGTGAATQASLTLQSPGGDCVALKAKTAGTWGKELAVNVANAEEHAFVEDEVVQGSPPSLAHSPAVKSARNRIRVKPGGGGLEQSLEIIYTGTPIPGQVLVDLPSGNLSFGDAPGSSDEIRASYMVDKDQARKVTVRYRGGEEVFTIVSGDDLIRDLEDPISPSAWVEGEKLANSGELPDATTPDGVFHTFGGGNNGAAGANYEDGLDKLLDQPAHIIVAAGQDDSFGDELAAHCRVASSDDIKRDRIAVVGSQFSASLSDLQGHTLSSDRLIFVAPGIKTTDTAATPPTEVTLPGAYTAAAIAGLLASLPAHVSPTNKVLQVGGLEKIYSLAELKQLVQSRVLVLEERRGFRITRGITTATNTAWQQITTRRIVDVAKFGVRAAANPFIGRLNNDRVRGALRTSVNSFLAEMVRDEMLISYELTVSATREQEIRGIVEVTMVLRPVFSIEFIKVIMFLE